MEKIKKKDVHKEGLNHVGGEIRRRMKAKDYCMQINTRTHRHKSMRTHMHVIFTLLTVKFRWSNPNYYN